LRYQHAEAIRERLAEGYAPTTANKMLSAMKGVLESCWHLGLMTADERDRASDVEPVCGTRLPPGRSILRGELRSLLGFAPRKLTIRRCGPGTCATRRCLPCSTSGARGGRSSRASSSRITMPVSDYDAGSRTLRIRRKGNKERAVYAERGADLLLSRLAGAESPTESFPAAR